MTRQFELSRRKALIGLGTIGAAGAGAGMGTSALFSDEEEFENNSITAGTTNLRVQAIVANDNIGGNGSITLSEGGTNQNVTPSGGVEQDGDDPTVNFTVSDIKPGDSFILGFDAIVDGNPMYVGFDTHNLSDSENTPNPEPEPGGGPDTGNDAVGGSSNEGDLDNKMLVTHLGYLTGNANDGIQTGVGPGDITNDADLGSAPLSLPLTTFLSVLNQTDRGYAYGNGSRIFSSSTPPGHTSDIQFANDLNPTKVGDGTNADTGNVTHYIRFELPTSVGNVVQGDSVKFSLQWHAQQARNNDDGDLTDADDPDWRTIFD